MQPMRRALLVLVVFAAAIARAGAADSTFVLQTSAFLNGDQLPRLDAAGGACGGRNVSPPLRFTAAPTNAHSLALVVLDTDAAGGRGFTHWIAYGIAPTLVNVPSGFGSAPGPAYVGGKNDNGTTIYYGPCPPIGDPPHHYVFTAYALDLSRTRLPGGLTRSAFLSAIRGHTLATSTLTATYARSNKPDF